MSRLLARHTTKWAEPLEKWAASVATIGDVGRHPTNRSLSSISSTIGNNMPRVLITGGTDGIGKEAAVRLAAANNDVVFSGRDARKAQDVIEHCQKHYNNTPRFIKTDLSLESEIHKFAAQIAEEQFDACILNAGVIMPKPARTAEDREATMMTNLISSYVIAHKMLESRRDEQRPIHFVFSTSILIKFHSATPFGRRYFNPEKISDWEQCLVPSEVSGVGKYAVSKIGLATLSTQISRLALPNVTATSVHPGTVYTNIMSNLPARQQLYIRLARPFITSLEDAGANLVRAARQPLPAGMFYETDTARKLPEIVCSEKTCQAFEHVFRQFRI
ncbi:unnamed protein product [Caenorhabditis sp. 36 PRJEB53466]|nr:unnamed protein product [Caenorhabditis sp. 36 PRJEB53466]